MNKDDLKNFLNEIVNSLSEYELENLNQFLIEKDEQIDILKELTILNTEVKNSNRVIKKLQDEIDELKRVKFVEFYKKIEIAKEISENLPKFSFFKKSEFLEAVDELKEVINELESNYEKVLNQFNIKPLAKIGDKFDMNLHEAIDGEGNMIVEVYEQGFKYNDKVLNYAKVKVGNE